MKLAKILAEEPGRKCTHSVSNYVMAEPCLDEATNAFFWAGLETPICIISTCLPSIFSFARYWYQKNFKQIGDEFRE